MMSLADSTADSTPDFACSTTPLATRLIRLATERARFAIVPAAFVTALLRAVERFRVLDLRGEDFLADDFFADDLRADDFFAEDFRAGDFRADDLRAEDLRADDFEALFLRAGPRELDFRAPPLFRADFVPRDADFREEDLRAGPLRRQTCDLPATFLPSSSHRAMTSWLQPYFRAPMLGFCCDTIATSRTKTTAV